MFVNILMKERAFKNVIKLSQKANFVNFHASKPRFLTKYGGHFTATMIKGIGLGPQLMEYLENIFESAKIPVNFEAVEFDHISDNLDDVKTAIRRNGVAIKANIHNGNPNCEIYTRNLMLLKEMNLYANVIHCKSERGIQTRHRDVDILLIRENTEGEYSCSEHEMLPGIVESHVITTRKKTEEIARFAFQYAEQKHRRNILTVHRGPIMPHCDGLFINVCNDVAKEYPGIKFDTMSIDTCCRLMVSRPQVFDVLLLPNIYGNALSSIGCGLVGGAGVVTAENYGHDCVVFEIGSRSAVPKDNPVAVVNASIKLLYYLDLEKHAKVLEHAIHETINTDKILTPDLGGKATAEDVVNHVMQHAREEVSIFKPLNSSI